MMLGHVLRLVPHGVPELSRAGCSWNGWDKLIGLTLSMSQILDPGSSIIIPPIHKALFAKRVSGVSNMLLNDGHTNGTRSLTNEGGTVTLDLRYFLGLLALRRLPVTSLRY